LWCDPPADRGLETLWSAFYILGGIIFGFPLVVVIIRYLLVCRVAERCYPDVRGVSSFEFVARSVYFCFFCKRFNLTYRMADENIEEKNEESGSRFFRCCRKRSNEGDSAQAVEV